MTDEKQITKLDISSTAIEKGIEVAKSFAEKLVLPSIEELGLLVRDQISYWRFNNQIQILTKAKAVCEKNNISIKAIPPKLLCPYLEYASLEDNPDLQSKWATLLANMVDSKQNIQNHVFPYILSQLSKDEFSLLESAANARRQRIAELTENLNRFQQSRAQVEQELQTKKAELEEKLKAINPEGLSFHSFEAMQLRSQIQKVTGELSVLNYRESSIRRKIAAPEPIPEQTVKEFEIANIIRLGLAKVVYEASAGPHSIDIPGGDADSYRSIDFDIQIDTDTRTILTELGELFIEACCEKGTRRQEQSTS